MNGKSNRPSNLVIGMVIVCAILGLLYGITNQLYWLLLALVVIIIALVLDRHALTEKNEDCLLYTSPSPRDPE